MNTFFEITGLNQELLIFLIIDITIAIILLGAMRFISGVSAQVNSTDELAKKDNFAFGISVAGSVAALGIVLTGAISGENAPSYLVEFIGMFAYGITGLLLIKAGRFVHDRLTLNEINKTEQIISQNITVGLVDAAGAIATAIIIRAVLLWVHGLDVDTFVAIIAGFAISQAILLLVTRIKERQYANNNQGASLQQAFAEGQTAIAIRYTGQLISTALAVTAASHFLTYSPETLIENLVSWFIFALAMVLLVSLLTALAKRVVLWGINLVEEVDQQQNIGVAFVEMAISISIALLLTALMG